MPLSSSSSKGQLTLSRLLLAATVLHITFTIGIFLVGRLGVLPNTFDEYGIGTSFAIDSKSYRIEAEDLADALRQLRFADWNSYPRIHVKLYSLSFVLLDKVLGPTILSAEPVNLTYFLLILGLIYALGKEVFDQRVGSLAAVIVMLWPSFLLHTTQMLRDPLFIAAFLLLMLMFVILLTRSLTLWLGVMTGLIGGLMCLFLWLIRGDWWELIFLILLIGIGISFLKQILKRKFLIGNTIGGVLILLSGLFLPLLVPAYRQSNDSLKQNVPATTVVEPGKQAAGLPERQVTSWGPIPKRIGLLRHRFILRYPEAGSNIDRDVELSGWRDLVSYAPRALIVGILTPFPNMWVSRGAQVGLPGRLLAGAEMVGVYIIVFLALLCALFERRRWPVWLVLATVAAGVTALGLVVVNISTIYRMRYGFVMLLIVLAAKGFLGIQARAGRSGRIRNRQLAKSTVLES